jgi:hypothetical protein
MKTSCLVLSLPHFCIVHTASRSCIQSSPCTRVFCILYPASCTCFLYCILHPLSIILYACTLASGIMYPVSFTIILYPLSCVLLPASCILCPAPNILSCVLYPVLHLVNAHCVLYPVACIAHICIKNPAFACCPASFIRDLCPKSGNLASFNMYSA